MSVNNFSLLEFPLVDSLTLEGRKDIPRRKDKAEQMLL